MTHWTEDDLILHYYGESPQPHDVETHLRECRDCAETYRALAEALALVPITDVPHRDDAYPLDVWQRLRGQLPAAHGRRMSFRDLC